MWGVDSLGCNGCHGYPILSGFPDVSAGAGDSHAWVDDYGYINLHVWNMGFDPVQCSTCHNNTVKDAFTWIRDDYSIQIDNISIFNKSKHVNGTKDVAFTQVPVPYNKYSGTVYKDLSTATYDANTKNCSNVACHFQQTQVKWGSPYRWWSGFECNFVTGCKRCDTGNHMIPHLEINELRGKHETEKTRYKISDRHRAEIFIFHGTIQRRRPACNRCIYISVDL